MDIPARSRLITFRHPFTLSGLEGPQPAGNYLVRTDEPSLVGVSSAGWRPNRCLLGLIGSGAITYVTVDAQELREALVRDGDQGTDPPAAPAVASRAPRPRRRGR